MEDKNYTLKEYFENIKEELRTIRKRRIKLKELESNLRVYKSPILFARYFIKYRSIDRISGFRKEIIEQNKELKERYKILRKEYTKRFNHLDNKELIDEYEKKSLRLFDLENRKEDLNEIKRKISSCNIEKKKQLERVLCEFKSSHGEFERRKRDMEELFEKMKGRGIDLEMIYTNEINNTVRKNKKKKFL